MDIELVPLAEFSDRIRQGWSMLPGYPLKAGDYAIIMRAPGPVERLSNVEAGCVSRIVAAQERRMRKAAV